MGEDEQLLGGRKPVQDLDATASGRATRAVQIIRRFDDDTACDDRCAQRCGCAPGIA